MHSTNKLITLFKENGLRITPQRRLIFDLLANDHTHPTVDDVYLRVKNQMPDISRSTVYNTLNELLSFGELNEIDFLVDSRSHFDTNTQHHDHLYCECCHRIIDISQNPIANTNAIEDYSGFVIKRRQITYFGICPDCQKQQE